MLMNIDCVLKL